MADNQTTEITARLRDIGNRERFDLVNSELLHSAAGEIEYLRGLVARLTNVAVDLAAGPADPGSEALAAIHCGRNFLYG